MEPRTRERLTGAAILVALIVLLVPELLSGPRRARPQTVGPVDEPPIRSYTLTLGDTQPGGAAEHGEGTSASVSPVPGAALAPRSAGQSSGASAPARAGSLPSSAASVPAGAGSPVSSAASAPGGAGSPVSNAAPSHDRTELSRSSASPSRERVELAPSSAKPPRSGAAVSSTGGAARAQERTHASPHREAPREHRVADHPPEPARSARGWAVQVGSFTSREHAERLARELKLKGYAVLVSESAERGRKWYRVRVGPERDRSAAAAIAARLRSSGEKGAIVQPR